MTFSFYILSLYTHANDLFINYLESSKIDIEMSKSLVIIIYYPYKETPTYYILYLFRKKLEIKNCIHASIVKQFYVDT